MSKIGRLKNMTKKQIKTIRKINGQQTNDGFATLLNNFILNIDGLEETLSLIMFIVEKYREFSANKFYKFLKKHSVEKKPIKDAIIFSIPGELSNKTKRLEKRYSHAEKAYEIIPCSLITTLISLYDGYLGHLIKKILHQKPEILKASDKTLQFAQLLKINSMKEAKECFIEQETEGILRENHIKQFKWLENKFNVQLKKDLNVWPIFVELTERRNLFVHSNGIVSRQYLKICKENHVNLGKTKIGDKLKVTPEYFKSAYSCIFEIGTKLTHVLWRKSFPSDIENADKNFIETTFNLLQSEKYELAIILLNFITETKVVIKKCNDETRRIYIINKAIAYKFSGNTDKAKQIIESEDWSACDETFKLAEAILKDQIKKAIESMRKIGQHGKIGKNEYREWPLFKHFRNTKNFKKAYKQIFKETFRIKEKVPKTIKKSKK